MRLLYVIDSLAPGGAETSLAEMAPGLIAQGIDLHVLPLGDRLDLAPRLEAAGAVVHVRARSGGRLNSIRSVVDVVRRISPSLVHTTLFEADIAGRTAARLSRIPVSTSLVNDSYGASHQAESNALKLRAARTLDASTARFATSFHAISEAVAEAVVPRLGIPRAKVHVVPRGRDPQRFPFRDAEARRHTRADLGLSADVPVVLAVGRLEPQKGLQHLIAALPQVRFAHPDVVLLIAGKDGRAGAELRSSAAHSGAEVRFLGHRGDVAALLAAADAFCFPSEREGFGGVLVEALAVGCPIVASTIPTSIEVLQTSGECVGCLSPVGDTGELASSISTVLSHRAASSSMARRGRAHFEDHYTIDAVDSRMATFFRRAVLDHAENLAHTGGFDRRSLRNLEGL